MSLKPRQNSIALVMWARLFGYVGLGFFALAFVSLLGWKPVIAHQFVIGATGCILFFGLSLWILRFLPETSGGPDQSRGSEPGPASGR